MRSRKRSQWVIVGSAAVISASAVSIGGVASAGPVAPGQTVQQAFGDQPEFQFSESMVSGLTLVSQGSQSFETTVVPNPGTTFPGGSTDPITDVAGTLTNSVFRDPSTGNLSFLYRFDLSTDLHGAEDTQVDLTGFDSFATDIFFGNGHKYKITRSANGDELTFHNFGGIATVPEEILIRTDAREFSSDGTLRLHTSDEFDVFVPPDLNDRAALGGDTTLTGTFAPTSGAQAIPLPAAALPAMGMLTVLGGAGAWRRRRTTATR
jgi:hypothetical protein